MAEEFSINGYNCPQKGVVDCGIVELFRHKEHVAKWEGPITTKVMEYLAEYIRWHYVKDITKLKVQFRQEHGISQSISSLSLVGLLRFESPQVPSRRLSQPANSIRAVSIVDVEKTDVDVATCMRRLLAKL